MRRLTTSCGVVRAVAWVTASCVRLACAACSSAQKCKMFGTSPSHVVTYHSTADASWCLSSKFRWVSLLSPVYDRT